jgi:hypothetical protein
VAQKSREAQAFDACLASYRHCRALRDGRPGAVNPFASARRLYRPDRLPRLGEYIADFEACCLRAMQPARKNKLRIRFVRLYYIDGHSYRVVLNLLGLTPGTLDRWNWELRRRIGTELLLRGLYPPARYFKEPTLSLPTAMQGG